MATATTNTIRVQITEIRDDYIVGKFLGSNKFWDETDLAFEYIKFKKPDFEFPYTRGDIIIVRTESVEFSETSQPLPVEEQKTQAADPKIYTISGAAPNYFDVFIDAKMIVYPLPIILVLGFVVWSLIYSLKKLSHLEKNKIQ